VEEWGGIVLLREMDGVRRDVFDERVQKNTTIGKDGEPSVNMKGMKVAMVALCVVDADGKQMFTEDEMNKASGTVIENLFLECQELNGIGDTAEGEMRGNS